MATLIFPLKISHLNEDVLELTIVEKLYYIRPIINNNLLKYRTYFISHLGAYSHL